MPEASLRELPGRLDRYLDMLLAWNRAINLTGGRDRADILARLIPDSFHLAAFLMSAPLARAVAGAEGPRVWD
ncbi:MAG: class I SAM-dependent methyltransferase, partial [Desulfovibrio sp.]|nr:class I SAM-dependent methyltransferase [Desulfovibrio sp.]